MKLGLMFFSSGQGAADPYDLVLRAAELGDREGLSCVWVPERHFAELGCLFPEPSVLQAAVAARTRRIGLRAASVVMPLHDPIRVAEQWSMVDALSGGRVGLSFAPGWSPRDFAFFPERYERRHDAMIEGMDAVRRLWRGEAVTRTSGTGETTEVRTWPRPVQPELPVWLTAASDPRGFVNAGRIGANLLTHMLDQDLDGVAERIALYREARAEAGFDRGEVALMLHTFVGADADAAKAEARGPLAAYLRSNAFLLKALATARGRDVDLDALDPGEADEIAGFLADRFAEHRALIGSPESLVGRVEELRGIGVDEIACLLDFGPTAAQILDHLPHLAALRAACEPGSTRSRAVDPSHLAARLPNTLDRDGFYARAAALGAELGPRFRGVSRVWWSEDQAIARLDLPPDTPSDGWLDVEAIAVHSSLLLPALVAPDSLTATDALVLPTGFDRFEVFAEGDPAWAHLRAVRVEGEVMAGDVAILDADGNVLVDAIGMRYEVFRLAAPAPEPVSTAARQALRVVSRVTSPAAALAVLVDELGAVLERDGTQLDPGERVLDLGLDSIMAIELRGRIEARTGARVPVVALLQNPRLAEVAALLVGDAGRGVVRLADGDGPPVVVVHPIGGSVHPYRHLAARLGRPVVGVEHPGLHGEPAEASITDLAGRYLSELGLSGDAPLHLIGWSLGGVIAHEMARQHAGPTALVLIDSYARAEDNLHLFPSLRRGLDDAAITEALAPADRLDTQGTLREVFRSSVRARASHTLAAWDGAATLVAAATTPAGLPDDPTLGWGALIRDLTVATVPGDHLGLMLPPHVDAVADAVRAALGAHPRSRYAM